MDATTLIELNQEDRILVELAASDEGFVGTVDTVEVPDDYQGAIVRVAIDDVVEPNDWDTRDTGSHTNGGQKGPSAGSDKQASARDWDETAIFITTDDTMDKPEIKPARDEKARPNPRDDTLARAEHIERGVGEVPDMDH